MYLRLGIFIISLFLVSPTLGEEVRGPFRPVWYEENLLFVNKRTHNIVFYIEGNKISFENRGKDSSCLVLTDNPLLYILPVEYGRGATTTLEGNILYVQCSNSKSA